MTPFFPVTNKCNIFSLIERMRGILRDSVKRIKWKRGIETAEFEGGKLPRGVRDSTVECFHDNTMCYLVHTESNGGKSKISICFELNI